MPREASGYGRVFKALGKRYKDTRRKRKISQKQVIEAGFDVRALLRYEAGSPSTMSTFFKVCQMLEVHPGEMLKGIPFPK